MPNGYWNRVLRVDLTTGETRIEEVSEEVWKLCVGGAGYGAKVLLEETTMETGAFDPENPIIFGLGPYQSGINPGSAKWTIVTKSPLTGTYADSAAGADWGARLKAAGLDAIVVKGAASKPVYLLIDEDKIEIKDATELWGMDAYEAYDAVRERESARDLSVVTIGPAGENQVAIACVVADAHSFAGRGGHGAVMGSKNLKAIAVRGSLRVPVFDGDRTTKLARERTREIYQTAVDNGFREHGTPSLCEEAEALGDMPIKYWSGDTWAEGAKKVGGENFTRTLNAKPMPCANCPIACHRDVEVAEGPYKTKGPGPEYETIGMIGSNLLIDDPKAIAKANDVCNRLGLDTISAGACVGFAMECYERGWLSEEQTGLDLSWGNVEATLELLEQIGHREGFGAMFAGGTLAAARQINAAAEQLVAHVKGMDLPAHDARAMWSLAINYATGTRGACHFRGPTEDTEMGGFFVPEIGIDEGYTELFSPVNKSELTVKLQDYAAWINSAVLCMFMVDGGDLQLSQVLDLFNAVTGWDWTVDELMESGERIFTLQRLVNIRDGHGRHSDTLPYKMKVPAKEGFRAGKVPTPFEPYLDEYYELRGWTREGIPTPEVLKELGLERYGELAGVV